MAQNKPPALLPALAFVLLACGSDRPARTEDRRREVLEKSPLPATPPSAPPSPYESPGELAPAARPVLGVAVPRIARVLSGDDDGIAVVSVSGVPYETVERFFRKRLETGRIEQAKRGAHILGARPRPPGNPRRRVDVTLRGRGGSETVVSIFDKTPTKRPAPQGDQAVREALGPPITFGKRMRGINE